MNGFDWAITAVKNGKKVTRAGWNGKGQYIELAFNIRYDTETSTDNTVNHDAMGNKAIVFNGTSGKQIGWLASQADMLSDDWMEVR